MKSKRALKKRGKMATTMRLSRSGRHLHKTSGAGGAAALSCWFSSYGAHSLLTRALTFWVHENRRASKESTCSLTSVRSREPVTGPIQTAAEWILIHCGHLALQSLLGSLAKRVCTAPSSHWRSKHPLKPIPFRSSWRRRTRKARLHPTSCKPQSPNKTPKTY
jgi:hypothetical protein